MKPSRSEMPALESFPETGMMSAMRPLPLCGAGSTGGNACNGGGAVLGGAAGCGTGAGSRAGAGVVGASEQADKTDSAASALQRASIAAGDGRERPERARPDAKSCGGSACAQELRLIFASQVQPVGVHAVRFMSSERFYTYERPSMAAAALPL